MSERQWFPQRLEYCLPTWFRYDPETSRRLQMRSDGGGVEWTDLAPAKFVEHRVRAKSGIPIRGGIARCAAWWYLFKNFGVKDWLEFIDVYGHPLRIGRYDRGSSQQERDVLRRAVANIATDAAAIVPEGMLLEFVESSGTAAHGDLYHDLLRYCDDSMSKAVLGQTLTTDTGESGGGSYSLGKVHNEVRKDIEHSDSRQLAATLTRSVAVPIVLLNHGPRKLYPKVVIGREERVPPEVLSESLSKLPGLRVRAQEVRDTLHLSEPEDGDEVFVVGGGNPEPGPDPGGQPGTASARGDPPRTDILTTAAADGEQGTVEIMAEALRPVAGPLVDRWTDPVRDFVLESADSLGAVRDWIDGHGVEAIDVSAFVAALGEALVAAELAGRYDVSMESGLLDEQPATAAARPTASTEHSRLTFREQIEFFRGKLDLVDTETWTDVWQKQHDKAFMVAGAKGDLLTDLHAAVKSAIADGGTLREFQADFDGIVARRGWTYNGNRDWRTRVIYGTNLRTSYAAGRYRQLKENSDALPYWQYRHSHLASTPRQQHLAWDGMVLAHDDPFWTTHYPPNGWGCGCYVIGVTRGRLERMGRTGPDRAPAIRTREVLVGKNGPHPRLVSVPEGIDPGWAYAPGQSVVRTYLDKLAVQQPGVAAAQYREAMGLERLVAERTRAWHGWLDGDRRSLDHWFVLGMVESGVQRALGDHGRILETAALTTTRSDILHGGRKTKRARGTALSEADLRRLPEIVERPKAVLLDTGKRHDALIYVFDSEDGGGRLGKAVFRPNWRGKRGITNGYRSGGYVDRGNLRERRYVVLSGSLEGEE